MFRCSRARFYILVRKVIATKCGTHTHAHTHTHTHAEVYVCARASVPMRLDHFFLIPDIRNTGVGKGMREKGFGEVVRANTLVCNNYGRVYHHIFRPPT